MQPMLALLLGGRPKMLHAGVAKGPLPGKSLCTDQQMWQHPLFARDPHFGPGVDMALRHAYALAALRINTGSTCWECERMLVELGGNLEYPWLDPVKAGAD